MQIGYRKLFAWQIGDVVPAKVQRAVDAEFAAIGETGVEMRWWQEIDAALPQRQRPHVDEWKDKLLAGWTYNDEPTVNIVYSEYRTAAEIVETLRHELVHFAEFRHRLSNGDGHGCSAAASAPGLTTSEVRNALASPAGVRAITSPVEPRAARTVSTGAGVRYYEEVRAAPDGTRFRIPMLETRGPGWSMEYRDG